MKVTQIRLAGHGDRPSLALGGLSPELNVLFGLPGAGKSTVAQLAAHVMYGRTERPWHRNGVSTAPLAEGSVDVDSTHGHFVLRRHRDGSPYGRLTVAAASGGAVDSRTIRTLLGGLPATLLAELFAVDFAAAPQASTLLEGEFARQFTQSLHGDVDSSSPQVCAEHSPHIAARQVDRRRVDDLVRRRDEIVRQIEEQMSDHRRGSAALEQEITQLDATLANRRQQAQELAGRLQAVDAKLAEIATRLRYFTLDAVVRPLPLADSEDRREAIERLDAEIGRCRQMLADLQSRDGSVRRELAEVHPDGTADSVAGLAEQRATIGVLERLMDDLDAEVSGLARSHEPGRCIAIDAHGRMLPVAQMLRQQLYSLCGQVTEQERAVRRVQLRAEVRQLSRAQADLSEQLEHLLERRQGLVHETQIAGRVAAAPPQAPIARHCQCERHDEFIRDADEALLTRSSRAQHEDGVRARRTELEDQRRHLREVSDTLNRDIAALAARWERLQGERGQVVGRSTHDELRAELERLEAEINRALHAPVTFTLPSVSGYRRVWKASDALAQLSGGQLTQIRISRDGRPAVVVDREGRPLTSAQLTPAQNDQLYLALTLALASSLASRGIDLPLILDEPFLRQDPPAAAAMAGVLAEFAREGRQVLVLIADREASRRFESLGVEIVDLEHARRHEGPVVGSPRPAPIPQTLPPTVRVVRETADRPAPHRTAERRVSERRVSDRTLDKPIFYLTADASIGDFPVLGNDTAQVFATLGLRTVEDLLAADATEVARRLAHPAVTADAVRLWQQHTSLMCFVPGVSLADAQVLAACEVNSPEALYAVDVRLLAGAVSEFLTTDRGRRFASSSDRFTVERLAQLQKHARRHRDRWQLLSPRYGWVERLALPPSRIATQTAPQPKLMRRPVAKTPTSKPRLARTTSERPLRFLLDRSRPVVDAPSIGPTLAERLAQVGVRTVADLLNASAESTAAELGIARVTAAIIGRWQAQARLACRVPELRGAGAQLLVACGLTEPEQIAKSNVAELLGKIHAVCRTTEGKRYLRGGEVPNAARVASWIRHAAHTRPLEAA